MSLLSPMFFCPLLEFLLAPTLRLQKNRGPAGVAITYVFEVIYLKIRVEDGIITRL